MTPTPREKRTRTRTQQVTTSEPASKKPRYETTTTAVSTSATGCIQVTKVDPSGGFVEIKNTSNEVRETRSLSLCLSQFLLCTDDLLCISTCVYFQIETLGGFKIVNEIDEENEVTFRFHNKSKLQGGASVTVSESHTVLQMQLRFAGTQYMYM